MNIDKSNYMQKLKTLPKDEEALYLSESSISTMSENSRQSLNCSLPENAGSQNKKMKKIQKLRNFWHQEFQPKLIGDRRATYFLKLFSSNFSLQFLMSLDLIYDELQLPVQQLSDFHQAVLDIISQHPILQRNYPKYTKKFSDWCSKPHAGKQYRGKNYSKYKSRVTKTHQMYHSEGEDSHKKNKPPNNEMNLLSAPTEVCQLQEKIQKKDELISKLLSMIFQHQMKSILDPDLLASIEKRMKSTCDDH